VIKQLTRDYGVKIEMINSAVMGFELFKQSGVNDEWQEECFASGSVRFDGCMNVDFKPHNTLLHLCNFEQWGEIGAVVRKVFEIASTEIENWCGEDYTPSNTAQI
jgi:hypothetical protein